MEDISVIELLLSSALGVALVTALKEIIIWILNRKAHVSDKHDSNDEIHKELKQGIDEGYSKLDKLNKRMDKFSGVSQETQEQIEAIAQGTKLLLQEKILSLAIKYIDAGEITHEQRKLIHAMWDVYHHGLNGNGDLDIEMGLIDELPLKNTI